jgi:hypothetical protein
MGRRPAPGTPRRRAAPEVGITAPLVRAHEGAVLFNWHAPELWRRFTIALGRALGRRLGIRERELRRRGGPPPPPVGGQ